MTSRNPPQDGRSQISSLPDEIIHGDCLEVLPRLQPSCAQLIIADPPYNIGYSYDNYDDTRKYEDYCSWSRQWMQACRRVLAPAGSMYVIIGDDYAAELRLIGRGLGLTLRNWIVWHYTFGQNTKKKFTRSHAHIFYFVVDPHNFIFNDQAVRILSDRQKQYADRRAHPAGKIPDDTWVVFPRVCGRFSERADGPNQLPEALVARIIRASSNPGDLVLDPFCGAGTTAAVASQLARHYLSMDISADYVHKARQRIGKSSRNNLKIDHLSTLEITELTRLYQENEIPAKQLLEQTHFLTLLAKQLNQRLANCCSKQPAQVISAEQITSALCSLASRNLLPVLRTDQPSLRTRTSGPARRTHKKTIPLRSVIRLSRRA